MTRPSTPGIKDHASRHGEATRGLRTAQRAALAACLLWSWAPAVRAATPEAYAVDARIDPDAAALRAVVRVRVRRARDEPIRLWWLAARVAHVPEGIDEQTWRWVYPGEADRGVARIDAARVDGRRVSPRILPVAGDPALSGTDVVLDAPGPAGTVDVELRIRLALPRRFGRFGRHGGASYLLGPWYPIVVGEGGGHRFRVPHRLRLAGGRGTEALVGDRRLSLPADVRVTAPYVPVILADRLRTRRVRRDGTTLVVHSADDFYDPPPQDAVGLEALDDLVAIDRVGLLAEAWAGLPATLRAVGLAPPSTVSVVVLPSRTELAGTAPGLVLASDRTFEIFPIDGFRGFHLRALREAMLRHVVGPAVDALEPPEDRAWAAELRARVLADLDAARREDEAKSPRELLAAAAFHPVVDNLLYARQVPFLDVYFEAGTSPSPFREDPDQARAPRPKPRRLLENARLVVADDAYAAFLEGVASGAAPARALLARASPSAAEDLDDWLAPCPVNYRLGAIASERTAAGHQHTVEVLRDGRRACDVVEILVRDTAGNEVRAVWRDAGPRGQVVVTTPAPVDRVVIDPSGRIVQDPGLADGHPRADDATSWPFRPPILEAFGVTASLADGAWRAFATFSLKRRYDLENVWLLSLSRNPGLLFAGLRYLRGVGPKRHGNARVGVVGVGVDVSRLEEGFAGAQEGGLRLGLTGTAGLDTRRFRIDPREGWFASASGRLGTVFRDSGARVWTGALSGRLGGMVPLGHRHALLAVASGGWTFGESLETEKQRIGGAAALRGYQVGEVVGDGAVDGVVEYRFTALTDLAVNLLHLAWLREVQLAAFVGGGLLFEPVGSGASSLGLADVGGGLRFHVDYAGVQPGIVAVDVAWPLLSSPTRDGLLAGGGVAPAFYVYFSQYL